MLLHLTSNSLLAANGNPAKREAVATGDINKEHKGTRPNSAEKTLTRHKGTAWLVQALRRFFLLCLYADVVHQGPASVLC